MKIILIGLGWLSFLLGFIGIFLPILPTTPFMIFSAFCFSKSSPKFYNFILSMPMVGPAVTDWQKSGIIRLRAKIWATTLLAISLLFMYLNSVKLVIIIVFLLVTSIVVAFIWSRPSGLTSGKEQNWPKIKE